MINLYNLKGLKPIEIGRLIELYQQSKASISGTISVWGDTFGKPGDTLYSLKDLIVRTNSEVIFKFKGAKIVVHNPQQIFVNEMIIAIKTCDKIIWQDDSFNIKIEYSLNKFEKKIDLSRVKGNHIPRTDVNEPCFMLAAW